MDPDLLKRLYQECDGYAQRVHEKLVEDEGIQIQYSTLTRLLRDMGLRRSPEPRCDRVPDEPGAEMQHDTSPYGIRLGGVRTMLVASRCTCVTPRGGTCASIGCSLASG